MRPGLAHAQTHLARPVRRARRRAVTSRMRRRGAVAERRRRPASGHITKRYSMCSSLLQIVGLMMPPRALAPLSFCRSGLSRRTCCSRSHARHHDDARRPAESVERRAAGVSRPPPGSSSPLEPPVPPRWPRIERAEHRGRLGRLPVRRGGGRTGQHKTHASAPGAHRRARAWRARGYRAKRGGADRTVRMP
jgi:hypothetical protein